MTTSSPTHRSSNVVASRLALWLALLFGGLAWHGATCAADAGSTIRELKHTRWSGTDGFPAGGFRALAQTSDGYLWLATFTGLYRFDGFRFERFALPRNDRLSSMSVYQIFAPRTGGLWIGFTFGGAAFLQDGQVTFYSEREGLPSGSVMSLTQEDDGAVWAGTSTGLARFDGARWQTSKDGHRFPAVFVDKLLVDSAGALWAASENQIYVRPRGAAEFAKVPTPGAEGFFGLAESPAGEVWVQFLDRGLLRLQRNAPGGRRPATDSASSIKFDSQGGLWARSQSGSLVHLAHPESLPSRASLTPDIATDAINERGGLSPGAGIALIEDQEGDIWYGSSSGMDRFSKSRVMRTAVEVHSPFQAIGAGSDGALWFGDRGKGFPLTLYSKDGSRTYPVASDINCISPADDGALWLGSDHGLWRYAANRFEPVELPPEARNLDVQAMMQDPAGALWVSVMRRGLYRWADGQWSSASQLPKLPALVPVTLAHDARGRLWFGYVNSRIAMLQQGRVTTFTSGDGVEVGNVTALYGRRSTLWAGGEFGLARFDGTRFRPVATDDATALGFITGIVETGAGDVWLNGMTGIVRLPAAELARSLANPQYRVHGEVFGDADGVQGRGARLRPLPTEIEGTDGRLWFATDAGVYAVDPLRTTRNAIPPSILIKSITLDEKSHEPVAELTAPVNTRMLRFDYIGLSLTAPEKVIYRYRLVGVDKEWRPATASRQAQYANLVPGRYLFQVIAANGDGVWNNTGASASIVIPRAFTQTSWFLALCVALGLLLLFGLFQLRILQVSRRLNARHLERLAERNRIARELHDTLLQSTQGLVMRFQAVINELHVDSPARGMLDETLERADEVIAEGRNRVLGLRVPAADQERELSQALDAAGREFASGTSARFTTSVEGARMPLKWQARDEAYRIGREALLNAFRHSNATSIQMTVTYAVDGLHLYVSDNGVGFDKGPRNADERASGHWGIVGMRERAKQLGATLTVSGGDSAGTAIELRVPASSAYVFGVRKWRSRWPFAAGR